MAAVEGGMVADREETVTSSPTIKRTKAERRAARRAAAASQVEKPVADHLSPAVIERGPAGQIVGRQALTGKEERLASLLASGVGTGMAGELAGYRQAAASASRAKRSPAVAARVLELVRARIQRGAALSVKLVEDIITGKVDAPASVRLDAAKHVQRVAGIDVASGKTNEQKDLRTMTLGELEQLAAAFRDKGSRPTAPSVPGDGAQVIDVTAEVTT